MSNSWRGPQQEHARALERGRTAQAGEPSPASLAPTAAPLAPAKPIAAVQTKARATSAATPTASPKAQIEVRTHTDPPAKQRKPRIDLSIVKAAIAAGIAWLGGVTLRFGAILRDQWQLIARRMQGRWQGRSKGNMPRQTVVIGFAALAILILSIFWFTRGGSSDTTGNPLTNIEPVNDANLTALQPVEPNRTQPQTRQNTGPNNAAKTGITPPPSGVAPGQPRPKLSRLAIDPREKNKRYFTLASYSVNAEEYMLPLLEFLWSQGVEAAAIQAHNSKYFEVVALQPFTREELNSGAQKQYEDSLRAIGHKWKAESSGNDNLQGMYTKVYSGTAAKLSITKAN